MLAYCAALLFAFVVEAAEPESWQSFSGDLASEVTNKLTPERRR